MKTLRKTYSEILKLRNHAEGLIKAEIIRVCEKNKWEFNSYRFVFERLSDSEEIKDENRSVKRIIKLVKDFENTIGLFDPQWFYKPKEWKTWKDFAVKEIKAIKKKHNV